jgi:GT2 family glycosyltransferase
MERLIPIDVINQLGGEISNEDFLGQDKPRLTESQYCDRLATHLGSMVRRPLSLSKYKTQSDKAKVAVVVPVFNALDDVKQCLASIETSTHPNFHLLVADDASDQKVVAWLREYTKNRSYATLIESKENLGYTKNVNRAIASVGDFDYLILLNSDTIVCENWIEKLLVCYFDDNTVGIAGPLSNTAGWQSVPNLRGDNSLPPHVNVKKLNKFLENNSLHPYYPMSDLVNGFCMCISKKVLTEVGEFDEESFPRGYGEEDDFCMRARAAGFKNVLATTAYVYHSKSKSFGHSQRIELATASRKVLDKKYGKDGYRILTEAIGKNPMIEAVRNNLRKLYTPFKRRYSSIGEEVYRVETMHSLYSAKNPKIFVHLHLHYLSMADYFAAYLKNIPFDFDLFLTINDEVDEKELKSTFDTQRTKNVVVRYFENRGRDVFPFLKVLKEVGDSYEYALHIHTKKSAHNPLFGTRWLGHMMSRLLYNESYIENLIYIMQSFDVGLIVPEVMKELVPNYKWGKNKDLVANLFSQSNIAPTVLESRLVFPAGNMFWVKPAALKKIYTKGIEVNDFPPEPIPIDGTLAHALERAWSYIVSDAELSTAIAEPDPQHALINERRYFEEKLLNPSDIEDIITQTVIRKEPLALIRYFDGEGAFYKASEWTKSFLKDRMAYYFGQGEYTHTDAKKIRDLILSSLENADIIGIPNLDIVDEMIKFMNRYADGDIEKLPYIRRRYNESIDCNSAWRILSSFELVLNALGSDASFCTKDIHYDLVLSGALYRLMDKADKISVVTSQPVTKYIEQLFGKTVRQYSIPQRAIDNDNLRYTRHYPHVYNDILANLLESDLTGELFLVGAGPLGKAYCQKIKKRGGVAIDVGAVFDSWINFHTRPEHARKGKGLDTDLLLTSENIRRLTSGQVEPKIEIDVDDLPMKKRNKYLSA